MVVVAVVVGCRDVGIVCWWGDMAIYPRYLVP